MVYHCTECENREVFDVKERILTQVVYRYALNGTLSVGGKEVLQHEVLQVTCRRCGASGSAIEEMELSEHAG